MLLLLAVTVTERDNIEIIFFCLVFLECDIFIFKMALKTLSEIFIKHRYCIREELKKGVPGSQFLK